MLFRSFCALHAVRSDLRYGVIAFIVLLRRPAFNPDAQRLPRLYMPQNTLHLT
jgi:hypothetical protein